MLIEDAKKGKKGSPIPMKGVHLPTTKPSKKPSVKVPVTIKKTVTATNKNM